ncbi:crotonase/enoyl-CoA hydratase family protein [Rhizobiaceae bacterium BDR2-2]|uniref:Crotonase/enoyl-CoA hydratase family protein n=1 Tax=Ectorhizobium quercum TaxID=2965071 RepID=A0AAE3N0P7_9HYPH|nr:crotonase/enoyl-CoA hydratase family protein [Ectorhizobium quercum]MCX8996353.1 crotonase/enoyl-CoA hydratase family protein [Ectorhizobium quercum]MCX8998608.1 crotonase/enoyl-CoA hydratase family protein [Ectorhizobium quercum]
MSEHHILLERVETYPGVQIIRFNRPEKKNAITEAMYARMAEALTTANTDSAVRAIAFLGTDGCFTAGNDMKDFLAYAMGGSLARPVAFDFLQELADSAKPIVSGVDGLAIGIGTTINMHCDLTVASPRSLFKAPFVDLGLVPEAGSSLIAPRVMGYQRAFALLVAGEGFSGVEAKDAGLVYRVVEPDEVAPETLRLAARLASLPPEALAISRQLLRGDRGPLMERMNEELVSFAARLRSAEARRAFEAFLNR